LPSLVTLIGFIPYVGHRQDPEAKKQSQKDDEAPQSQKDDEAPARMVEGKTGNTSQKANIEGVHPLAKIDNFDMQNPD